jgi:hypothetical protein
VTYVGHGATADSVPLFDLWALDTLTYRWTSVPLHGQILPGRSGARAALVGRHLIVFGGYSEPEYLADLHTIDIDTGEVALLETLGCPPSPRSTPVLAVHANRLYVWGGFNRTWPTELNVLDLDSLVWTQHPQELAGRTAVPSVRIGDFLYICGGSQTDGIVALNLLTCEMEPSETIGIQPARGVIGAAMVRIDSCLLFFW